MTPVLELEVRLLGAVTGCGAPLLGLPVSTLVPLMTPTATIINDTDGGFRLQVTTEPAIGASALMTEHQSCRMS